MQIVFFGVTVATVAVLENAQRHPFVFTTP